MYTILILCFALSPVPVDSLPVGEVVRVTVGGEAPVQGTLARNPEGTLQLEFEGEDPYEIPLDHDVTLEVRKRSRRTGRGFLVGGFLGLGLGVLAGLNEDVSCAGNMVCLGEGFPVFVGGVSGLLAGGLLGAVIGSLIIEERWIEVPLSSPAEPDEAVELGVQVGDRGVALRIQQSF